MMPKMNGLEVLKTIRDKENLIQILMLLLSKRAIESVAESYEKQTKTTMIELPFSEVISEEAQSFQGLAKVKGKDFVVDIEPMLSLKGDEKTIRQLISILLDNAVKYCTEQGQIRLTAAHKGKNIILSVYNTSQPLTKENIDHLFDRFYRTDESRNSQTGGYGIGLSVAKAVVEAHHGKIVASSEDGRSLLITVILKM